ncbi:hypothetical protein Nos7524_4525 [Nostoc sp. PCC 7524]|uniref:hypothetical protein n=1 Tax=Nostoc sp. (strain ATCC 29411 / PCC 7524) TaxID=28072 RepID=UPI00029EE8D9|nr:hypothetical protein [Nostoc sp. PCC 7524]AFY50277.1 hypothetical protein Nos7524_4525 [Nostoc sp. PCC 7524]
MLQEVSTHLIIPEPSEDLIVNEPWSIEFYADGLMDELFADIDDILDLSNNLPHLRSRQPLRQAAPVASDWSYSSGSQQRTLEYEHLQTLDLPQIILPNTLNRPVQTVSAIRNKQVSAVVVDQPQVKSIRKTTQKAQLTLGKLLIVGTTIGVAIAGALYIVQSGVLVLITSRLTQPAIYVSSAQLPTQPDVQTELVNYMMGALAIIDKQNGTTRQPVRSQVANQVISPSTAIALNNNQAVDNLPSPLTANNTPPNPSKATNVVERIYIPVYQAPSPMRYAPPSIPGIASPLPPLAKSPTAQPNAVKNALNQIPPSAKPATVNMLAAAVRSDMKPVAVHSAPIKVHKSPNSLPNLPVIPFGATLPDAPTNANVGAVPVASLTVTPPAPAPTHTLEGLLELGNKSVALFQVNGVSRRFNIGESIGASGWTLVDVSNGEAIVRRNGEVRSIFAGQKL